MLCRAIQLIRLPGYASQVLGATMSHGCLCRQGHLPFGGSGGLGAEEIETSPAQLRYTRDLRNNIERVLAISLNVVGSQWGPVGPRGFLDALDTTVLGRID